MTFSGTDSGFDKFCRGGTRHRGRLPADHRAGTGSPVPRNQVDFIELPVARDAITVIVNARNTWAASMTVAELRTLWSPEADRGRSPGGARCAKGWPDEEISALRPGPRIRHLRLLHGRDQRRRARQPQGLHGERRRLHHRAAASRPTNSRSATSATATSTGHRSELKSVGHRRSRRQHRPGRRSRRRHRTSDAACTVRCRASCSFTSTTRASNGRRCGRS